MTRAITARWQELQHLASEQKPFFEPINRDVSVLVTNAEMLFEPSPSGRTPFVSNSMSRSSGAQKSMSHLSRWFIQFLIWLIVRSSMSSVDVKSSISLVPSKWSSTGSSTTPT